MSTYAKIVEIDSRDCYTWKEIISTYFEANLLNTFCFLDRKVCIYQVAESARLVVYDDTEKSVYVLDFEPHTCLGDFSNGQEKKDIFLQT